MPSDPKPYLDCPPCEACGERTAVGIAEISWWRPTDPAHRLYCPRCGHTFVGTDAAVEQAARADAAWEHAEATNDR